MPCRLETSGPLGALELGLAGLVRMRHVRLFSSVLEATQSLFQTLLSEEDFVLIDAGVTLRLRRGVRSVARRVHTFAHLDSDSLDEELRRVRAQHPKAPVLVVTQALFPHACATPDLIAHRVVADRYGATLLVDVSYDLGSHGPGGGGLLALQGMLGYVDLLLGDLSHGFGIRGGFIATNSQALDAVLKLESSSFEVLSPLNTLQAEVALVALAVVRSDEGERLRHALLGHAVLLHGRLRDAGFPALGSPTAFVPVRLGSRCLVRLVAHYLEREGVRVARIEPPLVSPLHGCLLGQLSASLSEAQVCDYFELFHAAVRWAQCHLPAARMDEQHTP